LTSTKLNGDIPQKTELFITTTFCIFATNKAFIGLCFVEYIQVIVLKRCSVDSSHRKICTIFNVKNGHFSGGLKVLDDTAVEFAYLQIAHKILRI
jgi:hypothetical protein